MEEYRIDINFTKTEEVARYSSPWCKKNIYVRRIQVTLIHTYKLNLFSTKTLFSFKHSLKTLQ